MSEQSLNDYELMVIFTPILNEEGFKKAMTDVQDFLKEQGGNTVYSNPWGLKQLSYPIQKKTTGIYWVLEFQALAETIEKLKIMLNRNENVMRHMITILDKHAVEYNAKKRSKSSQSNNSPAEESTIVESES